MYISSWRTWLFFGYISLIIYMSLAAGNELRWLAQLWKYDKIIHFTEYLGMGFLMINMMMIKPMNKLKWNYAIIFFLLFPVFDESLQYFSPRRIPDIYDAIADMCGGLTGAYIRHIMRH